jgi:hypothetical protein
MNTLFGKFDLVDLLKRVERSSELNSGSLKRVNRWLVGGTITGLPTEQGELGNR